MPTRERCTQWLDNLAIMISFLKHSHHSSALLGPHGKTYPGRSLASASISSSLPKGTENVLDPLRNHDIHVGL